MFQKIREFGCKGQKSNPLMLDEFQWNNEWVDENFVEITWAAVYKAIGASENLHGCYLPRAATARATTSVNQMYTKKRPRTVVAATPDIIDDEDNDHEAQVQPNASNAEVGMEVDGDSGGDGGGFNLDDDLLI
jgi:hypothetical protein